MMICDRDSDDQQSSFLDVFFFPLHASNTILTLMIYIIHADLCCFLTLDITASSNLFLLLPFREHPAETLNRFFFTCN